MIWNDKFIFRWCCFRILCAFISRFQFVLLKSTRLSIHIQLYTCKRLLVTFSVWQRHDHSDFLSDVWQWWKKIVNQGALKHGKSQQEWLLSKKFWGAHSGNQNLTPMLFLPWSWKWKTTIIEMYWNVPTIGGTHSMIMGWSVDSFKGSESSFAKKGETYPCKSMPTIKAEYFPWNCWWTLDIQIPPQKVFGPQKHT